MKKMLAVLLALMLALSCTMAMAETTAPATAPTFQGLTIESEYDVDRDTLKNVLTQMGMDETLMTLIDTFAAIVDQSGEKVVIANEGFQAELLLKGTSLLNLVGLANDTGLTFGSNLVPNYALNISFEELGQMLVSALQQAEEQDPTSGLDLTGFTQVVTAYLNDFIETCSTDAIIPGTPEQGEFVLDGTSYNIKVPMDISLPVILDASKALLEGLQNDETVQTTLLQMALMGVDVDFTDSASLDEIDPATLPVVKVETYMNLDENGQENGPTLVSVYVIPVGETTAATTVNTKVDGNNVKVDAQFADSEGDIELHFNMDRDPQDPFGTNSRLDAYLGNLYAGCAIVTSSTDQSVQFDAYAYLQDTEKPIATERGTMTMNGALTLGVADSATMLTLSDLTGDETGDVIGGVMNDLSTGAISILMTAYSAVPEIGAIVGQLMGGSDTSAEPAA